ncbi:hypothetical protein NDU88_000266 [Pleurodeles waltl]|uniref:Uncharacterized protein n=1 Tax=Pleurodeles waltl TaxID=8319 RepID=A0AAV7TFB9_PLEWA|nr:hypothetical protein NDU88_000266 [Pleurodeles waltl]
MPLAWALQGPPGAPRHPIPPSCSWRPKPPGTGWRYGGRNPHGEDSPGQRKAGGTPLTFRFWPRLYRRGQNAQWSTASLLAVLPRTPALAVFTARVGITPFVCFLKT